MDQPRTIEDFYTIIEMLDQGAFGYVYKARDVQTSEIVAVKQFKQNFYKFKDCLELREVRFLKDLKHPNIVQLKDILWIEPQLFLIYEFLDTDLLKFYTYYKNNV